MHSPFEEHLEAVYQILRYLKSTLAKGVFFEKMNKEGWGSILMLTYRKSTLGHSVVLMFVAILLPQEVKNKM